MLLKRKNEPGPRIIIPAPSTKKVLHPVQIRPRGKQADTIFPIILFFLIVMIILITFLMEIAKKMPIHGINIDLPKTDGITHVFENDTMLITIMQNGDIYLNEQKIDSFEKLKNVLNVPVRLQQQTESTTDIEESKDVLLQCDKDVPSDILFKFFAVMKDLNVRVFMITKPESSKSVNFDDGKN